jgi:hypothetical protein
VSYQLLLVSQQLLIVLLPVAPGTAPVASGIIPVAPSKEFIAPPSFGMKKATDVMNYWTNSMKSAAVFLPFSAIFRAFYFTFTAIIWLSLTNFP